MWTSTTKKYQTKKWVESRIFRRRLDCRVLRVIHHFLLNWRANTSHPEDDYLFSVFIFLLTARAAVESRLSVSIDKIEELDATMMNSEHVF